MRKHNLRVWGVGALSLSAAALLAFPAAPARAGYDAATGAASGSRDTSGMVNRSGHMTVVGTVVNDASNNAFAVRDAWGRTWNVNTSRYTGTMAPNQLQAGQLVRVYGNWDGSRLWASNLRLMEPMVATGTRMHYQGRYYTTGARQALTGVLTTDAGNDQLVVRDATGMEYRIYTRSIPDAVGLNKLQKGDRVRAYGYWIGYVGKPEPGFEATNVVVLR
jgi:hypothetical protein